jgi:EmrB/QacA subfamily drug resistance transporter
MTQAAMTKQAQMFRRRWWTFLVLALAILIVVIDHTILNVALPTLQRELGATISELQWIVDAYILAFATLLLTMGTLGDRIGRAAMLRVGMIVFGLASLAAVFSGSASHLVAARVGMGIGAAMIMPSTLAIITNVFPREERGKAVGAWGAMNGVGVALGPLVGGLLLEHFSWSAIFLINIPIVVTALVVGLFLVPNSQDPNPRRMDISGTLLSAITLLLLVFGLIKGSDWGWTNLRVVCSLAGAIIIGFLFILRESKTAAPMLDLGLFHDLRLSAGSGGIAIMTVAMFGLLFALTMYMQFVKDYSALQTGIRFLPIAFGYAFGSVSSNRTVRKWGTKAVVSAGFLGVAVLAPVVALWWLDTPYWQIGLLLFALSYFMGNIMAPSLNAVLGAVPKARAGVGSAVGNISFQVGGALGVAALGSALSSVYRVKMASASTQLASLPAEAVNAAKESVGAAATLAARLPDGVRQSLSLLSGESFMEGWQATLLITGAIGIIGAVLILKFMPPRDVKADAE